MTKYTKNFDIKEVLKKMKIDILGKSFDFDGPFFNFQDYCQIKDYYKIKNGSGVYVIMDRNKKFIDVGESDKVKARLLFHDRRECWQNKGGESLSIAIYYTNESERKNLEKAIRKEYDPLCGER